MYKRESRPAPAPMASLCPQLQISSEHGRAPARRMGAARESAFSLLVLELAESRSSGALRHIDLVGHDVAVSVLQASHWPAVPIGQSRN